MSHYQMIDQNILTVMFDIISTQAAPYGIPYGKRQINPLPNNHDWSFLIRCNNRLIMVIGKEITD